MPPAPKRKAWLWVLVAVIAVPVLFFGGCAAVIAFGSRNASDNPDDDYAGSRSIVGISEPQIGSTRRSAWP
jgi:flagellar basal body-associated protein FliL